VYKVVHSIQDNKEGQVRICVVGCGRVGITHIEAIKNQPRYTSLAGIVEIRKSLAKEVAEKYDTRCFSSLKEALKDPDIDAVILALPNDFHAEATLHSAEAGKHILVEKPMARDLNEANDMIRAAEQKNVNLMVGQSFRYYDAIRKVKSLVESGEIGKVLNLGIIYTIFANKEMRPSWWQSEEKTGGLVYTCLGSHAIDFIQWIFEGRKVEYVCAAGRSNVEYFEGEDETNIILRFEDGASASCLLSINTEPRFKKCLIVGDKGNISFEFKENKEGLVGMAPINLYLNGELILEETEAKNFENQLLEFANSVWQKREPETSGKKIKSLIEIIQAARLSSAKKCVIYV